MLFFFYGVPCKSMLNRTCFSVDFHVSPIISTLWKEQGSSHYGAIVKACCFLGPALLQVILLYHSLFSMLAFMWFQNELFVATTCRIFIPWFKCKCSGLSGLYLLVFCCFVDSTVHAPCL